MLTESKRKLHFLNGEIPFHQIFTPEDFSDEHKMIAEMTEKFAENEIVPVLEKIENQQFEEVVRLIKEAGELGLIGADVSEEDGGLELGKVSGVIIAEKLALGRSFSIAFGGQTGIGALPIAFFGTKEQKEKYLGGILTGDTIAAYALTEPSSGTDALSAKTTAVLSECGTCYTLNGEKQWITNSAFADLFIVYAKVDGDQFSAFIVEKNMEGVSTGPEEKKMGLKGSSTRSLILDNVQVPAENIIGEIGRGHVIAFNVLNMGRFKIAATSLGTAKRAIELAVTYANGRKQFGRPIAQFNLLKTKIADMTVQIYANESVIDRTAGQMQEGFQEAKNTGKDIGKTIASYAVECSISKVLSTEILDFIVDEAVQIHGGYGYMAEYEVETLYRDARVNRIFEGTNEINRIIIASSLLKEYTEQTIINTVSEGPLHREKQVLQLMKNLYHAAIQAVQEAELQNFIKEQETAAFIADLVIGIYAAESAILRAEKAAENEGMDRALQKLNCAKVYVHESAQRSGIQSLTLLNHLGDADEFSRVAGRLITSSAENMIEMKRNIANKIIQSEKYSI